MTELTKMTTEETGVEERLERLTVSPTFRDEREERSATPPPPRISNGKLHSSPSQMETSPQIHYCKLPVRHHELTPVMRNTNMTYADEDRRHVISPDNGELKGSSSLSIPSSSSLSGPRTALKRRSVPSELSLPPFPMGDRTRSLGHVAEFSGDEDNDDEDDVGETIQFPARKKFYSFNSRNQYHSQIDTSYSALPMQTSHEEPHRLIPYQPSRHDLSDVGTLPDEELSRIFIHKNPAPHEDCQMSIPSIHMANVLNGSTTDYTDEEDDLKDDASWSTRGSSLFIPDDNDTSTALPLRFTPTSGMRNVIVLEGQFPGELILPVGGTTSEATVNAVKRNKHDQAYEWLRTVGDYGIAEAASSKFLTRTTRMPELISRHNSSPATTAL